MWLNHLLKPRGMLSLLWWWLALRDREFRICQEQYRSRAVLLVEKEEGGPCCYCTVVSLRMIRIYVDGTRVQLSFTRRSICVITTTSAIISIAINDMFNMALEGWESGRCHYAEIRSLLRAQDVRLWAI